MRDSIKKILVLRDIKETKKGALNYNTNNKDICSWFTIS